MPDPVMARVPREQRDAAHQMKLPDMDGQLTPALYARLTRFYSDRQIMEMGTICAVLTGMAKLIFTFDRVTRTEQCPITPPAARRAAGSTFANA